MCKVLNVQQTSINNKVPQIKNATGDTITAKHTRCVILDNNITVGDTVSATNVAFCNKSLQVSSAWTNLDERDDAQA